MIHFRLQLGRLRLIAELTWSPAPVATPPAVAAPGPPRLIESPIAGRLHSWLVGLGSTLVSGRPVCVIGIADDLHEIESQVRGVVAEILVEPGQAVEVGSSLLRLDAEPREP